MFCIHKTNTYNCYIFILFLTECNLCYNKDKYLSGSSMVNLCDRRSSGQFLLVQLLLCEPVEIFLCEADRPGHLGGPGSLQLTLGYAAGDQLLCYHLLAGQRQHAFLSQLLLLLTGINLLTLESHFKHQCYGACYFI